MACMDLFPPHEQTLNLMCVVGLIDAIVAEWSKLVIPVFPSRVVGHSDHVVAVWNSCLTELTLLFTCTSHKYYRRQTTSANRFALVWLLLWSRVESTHVCLWSSLSSLLSLSLSLSLSLLMSLTLPPPSFPPPFSLSSCCCPSS